MHVILRASTLSVKKGKYKASFYSFASVSLLHTYKDFCLFDFSWVLSVFKQIVWRMCCVYYFSIFPLLYTFFPSGKTDRTLTTQKSECCASGYFFHSLGFSSSNWLSGATSAD